MLLSQDEGLGTRVRKQVKSERRRFVATARAQSLCQRVRSLMPSETPSIWRFLHSKVKNFQLFSPPNEVFCVHLR